MRVSLRGDNGELVMIAVNCVQLQGRSLHLEMERNKVLSTFSQKLTSNIVFRYDTKDKAKDAYDFLLAKGWLEAMGCSVAAM